MPDFQPLPRQAIDPHADLQTGNPRYGFGPAMPLGALFVLVAAIWWGLGVVTELLSHPARVDLTYLVVRGVGALVVGGVVTAISGARRRRNGGREAAERMRSALRTGTLPPGATAATWVPALEWRERNLRRGRWLFPIIAVLFALVGVALAVLDPREAAVGVGTSVLFLALIGYQQVVAARQLPRVRAMLRELGSAPVP